jgi:ribosomal protein L29
MAMKPKAIRALSPEDRSRILTETRAELMHERGLAAMGGSVKNPGKIRDQRTTIARILTVEQGLGELGPHHTQRVRAAEGAKAKPAAKKAKAAPKPGAKAAPKAKGGGAR